MPEPIHSPPETDNRYERRSWYFALALIPVALVAFGYIMLNKGIFACPADGYGDHAYLAYCNATAYGDFDHGAFWYGLVPDAIENVRKAEFLIVGSSRMQFGFSTDVTQKWFDQRDASYYLLGFTHTEDTVFFGPLMDKIKPSPRALVINADGFFDQRITEPTTAILSGGDAPRRYNTKFFWQPLHKKICNSFSGLCRGEHAVFRNYSTGQWRRHGGEENDKSRDVIVAESRNKNGWPENLAAAKDFLAQFDIDKSCILLTVVPSAVTPVSESRWLAQELDLPLIEAYIADLKTFDNSHLDKASAERWSAAFFEQASEHLENCVAKSQQLASELH